MNLFASDKISLTEMKESKPDHLKQTNNFWFKRYLNIIYLRVLSIQINGSIESTRKEIIFRERLNQKLFVYLKYSGFATTITLVLQTN